MAEKSTLETHLAHPPKEIKERLTENIARDFFQDDFKVSEKAIELYEKHCKSVINRGKLTPERYEAIIKYVRAGACITHAANAVGIDDKTLYAWLEKGVQEPDTIFGMFLNDFREAKSFSVIRNVGIVQRAATDDWTAAKWLLSVLEPEIYGQKCTVRNEISGPGGEAIKTEVVISDEELKKLTAIQNIIEEQNKIIDVEATPVEDEEEKEA